MTKEYEPIKPSESRYGFRDLGRKISSERYGAFIDRVFATEPRPARVVSVGDALIEGAFNRD
jgi:hypothetical protein